MMDPESIELQPVEKYNTSYLRKDELGRGKFGVVFQVTVRSRLPGNCLKSSSRLTVWGRIPGKQIEVVFKVNSLGSYFR